jgi:hypothetical protein
MGLNDKSVIKIIAYSVAASMFILTLMGIVFLDLSGFRQTLFFNNPNQLGYYSLVYSSIFVLASVKLKFKKSFILLTLLAYAQDNSLNASLNFTAAIIYFLFLNKISWNLSNSIRKWIMPEVILTRGAVDAFKQKLFWHIGPQWFSSMTFVLILAFPIEVISPMLYLEG